MDYYLPFHFHTTIHHEASHVVPDIIEGGRIVRRVDDTFVTALPLVGKVLEVDEEREPAKCFLGREPHLPIRRCAGAVVQERRVLLADAAGVVRVALDPATAGLRD